MNWVVMICLALLGIAALALALLLIATLWPRRHPFSATGRAAEDHRAMDIGYGVVFDQTHPSHPAHFDIEDGARLAAMVVGPADARDIIVLVHGIAAAGDRWNNPAGLLSGATGARVVALDLRGHNGSSGPRYDLERIGQYEDDIAEVISALRSDSPDSRIWLAGHSMGGGILLRYALKADRPTVSGYLLLAPVFGPGPTEVPPNDTEMRIDRSRIMGLMILNMFGLRVFNHLPVAYLNAPPEFPAYSFAALASGWPIPPRTAEDALDAMEGPFIIIAGAADTSIRVDGYQEVVGTRANGTIKILPVHRHDSFLNDCATHALIAQWIERCVSCPRQLRRDHTCGS